MEALALTRILLIQIQRYCAVQYVKVKSLCMVESSEMDATCCTKRHISACARFKHSICMDLWTNHGQNYCEYLLIPILAK